LVIIGEIVRQLGKYYPDYVISEGESWRVCDSGKVQERKVEGA
jgi:hypothetical protein